MKSKTTGANLGVLSSIWAIAAIVILLWPIFARAEEQVPIDNGEKEKGTAKPRDPRATIKTGDSKGIRAVLFSPDGTSIFTVARHKSKEKNREDFSVIATWDPETGQSGRTFEPHERPLNALAISPDGQILASADRNGCIHIWDVNAGKQVKCLGRHEDTTDTIMFSSDGKLLASGDVAGTVCLWDMTNHKLIRSQSLGNNGGVCGLAFSPDSTILAAGGDYAACKLWRAAATGKELGSLKSDDHLSAVAFSPDGKILVTAEQDGPIQLWDLRTMKGIRSLRGHSERVSDIIFSRDGATIVTNGQDKTIRVWETATGHQTETFRGNKGCSSGMCLSPDGKTLAAIGEDNSIKLWDLTSPK